MIETIRISRRADADVTAILEWIAQRSSDGVIHWFDAIEESINEFRQSAAGCSLAVESDDFEIELRQSTFRTRLGGYIGCCS